MVHATNRVSARSDEHWLINPFFATPIAHWVAPKKKPPKKGGFLVFGSSTWARTRDLRINRDVLNASVLILTQIYTIVQERKATDSTSYFEVLASVSLIIFDGSIFKALASLKMTLIVG